MGASLLVWMFFFPFFMVRQRKLSAQELQDLVKGERKVPLIVDFYATWCGPCILMAQELETVPYILSSLPFFFTHSPFHLLRVLASSMLILFTNIGS